MTDLTAEQAFARQVHETNVGAEGAVYPDGHQWAGLTKAEALHALSCGEESSAKILAERAAKAASVADTGKLEPKAKSKAKASQESEPDNIAAFGGYSVPL